MLSRDEGETWWNLDSSSNQIPVVADQSGTTMRITRDDEFEDHTWLSSFSVTSNKVHFLYLTQTNPPQQNYVRYDLASGKRDREIRPRFGDDYAEIRGLDGFFVHDRRYPPSLLYCLGRDPLGHVVCFASRDEGSTWRLHARSSNTFNVYSLGGSREVTRDGFIVGAFTDQHGDNSSNVPNSRVYFFRIQAL